MQQDFDGRTIQERIKNRLQWINCTAGDTVGGALTMELISYDCEKGKYRFEAHTERWMRNVIGTLHGGSTAVMVDQAMGCVANCLFEDKTHAPTSQLQLYFHRPMLAGEDFLITVQLINVSRTMIHTSAEVFAKNVPGKLCSSATAVFFRGN